MKNKVSRNNITIKLDKFGQAKYLNDCILHEISNGNNLITVNVEDSFSGSNVCAPIAGIIDYYRNNGIAIHVNCPRNSYANHVRIYNPIAIEDSISQISPFDKVYSFSSAEGVQLPGQGPCEEDRPACGGLHEGV